MAPAPEHPARVKDLLARGVRMPHPASVFVDDAVVPERIAADAVIHPGCRLLGAATSVGPGCVLGAEAPLTLEDCQLAANVELKGGYVSGAVFLDGANLGSGAHVRAGTLLEEEAGGAHAVGLKQTILLPYVTLGSLINFCDVLMAGGTSRKNHSEVGSSFIHFNYTPHQDKATPSLVGDVPRGVFLDQRPIFLGGQGGLVGPACVGFGCVTPAGSVFRGDAPGDGLILKAPDRAAGPRPYAPGVCRGAARVWRNNLAFIGNLAALRAWHRHVRALFIAGIHHRHCWEAALRLLDGAVAERVKRLDEWVARLAPSAAALRAGPEAAAQAEAAAQDAIRAAWPRARDGIAALEDGPAGRDAFIRDLEAARAGRAYLAAIPGLPPPVKALGAAWLRGIADAVARLGAN